MARWGFELRVGAHGSKFMLRKVTRIEVEG